MKMTYHFNILKTMTKCCSLFYSIKNVKNYL
nr:MAG TPA: hypothetical protein [Caudoviricetes sp.]